MLHKYWIDPSFFVVVAKEEEEGEEDSLSSAWFIGFNENGELIQMEKVSYVPWNGANV